jgi:hypothetical protein
MSSLFVVTIEIVSHAEKPIEIAITGEHPFAKGAFQR